MKKILSVVICLLWTCNIARADFAQYYNAGQQYLSQYQYSSAITEFKKALRINYMDNSARVGLINSYLARGTYSANKDRNWVGAANDYRAALFYLKYYPDAQEVQNSAQAISNASGNLNQCLLMLKFDTTGKSRFNKAKELRLDGLFPEAGYEFIQSSTDVSIRGTAYEQVADIMNVLGNDQKASEYYQKAIAVNPDSAQVRLKYARVLDKLGQSDDAVKEYNFALANGGDDPEILYALERYYRQKLALAPNDAATITSLGAILQKQNRLDEALQYYTQAAQYDPGNVTTRLNVGTLYQQKKSYDSAIAAYDSILLLYPDNVQANLFRAQCLAAKGDNVSAKAAFNKVLSLDPTNKVARAQVIDSLKGTMPPAEIIAYLSQNGGLNKDSINDLYDYAIELHKQKKFDQAIAYYVQILKVKSDNPEVYVNLAIAYEQKNDLNGAKQTLTIAKVKFPTNKQINDKLTEMTEVALAGNFDEASKYFNSGDYQKAISIYQSIQPATFDSLSGLAACYKALNQYPQAIEYYKRAIAITPNSDVAYYIGVLYSEKENWTAAKTYIKKALEINPQNKNAKDLLASVVEQANAKSLDEAIALYDKNDYVKALPILNKILQDDAKNAYAYYYRALINDAGKKYLLAIADYKKAILYNSGEMSLCYYLMALDYDSLSQFKSALINYKKYVSITVEDNEYKQYSQVRVKELKKYEAS